MLQNVVAFASLCWLLSSSLPFLCHLQLASEDLPQPPALQEPYHWNHFHQGSLVLKHAYYLDEKLIKRTPLRQQRWWLRSACAWRAGFWNMVSASQSLLYEFSPWLLRRAEGGQTWRSSWSTAIHLTHSSFKLNWCDPGMWRCLLKTCYGCYCCWCRSRFWSWSSGKILKKEFGYYFTADVLQQFMKLNLGRVSEVRFAQYFEFQG